MPTTVDGPTKPIGKIVFDSGDLPDSLNNEKRFALWRDIYTSLYGDAEISPVGDKLFSSRSEFLQFGDIGVLDFNGTVERLARSARHVARDARDDFHVGMPRAGSPALLMQRGRELSTADGQVSLYDNTEAFESRAKATFHFAGLSIPRARLRDLVANIDDLVLRQNDSARPEARLLVRYVDLLLTSEGIADSPQLIAHVNTTLLDLTALALGATGEVAEVAQARGLRAARLQQILAAIRAGYADPAFSPQSVAAAFGVTVRYLQKLLHDNGASFTERVLELRLLRATQLLGDVRNDRFRISEIAARAGFNDISHFNHCFRRRFGCSPTQYRGGHGA